jgi:hypothetical protein
VVVGWLYASLLMLAGVAQNFRVPEHEAPSIRDGLRDAVENGKVVELQTEAARHPQAHAGRERR